MDALYETLASAQQQALECRKIFQKQEREHALSQNEARKVAQKYEQIIHERQLLRETNRGLQTDVVALRAQVEDLETRLELYSLNPAYSNASLSQGATSTLKSTPKAQKGGMISPSEQDGKGPPYSKAESMTKTPRSNGSIVEQDTSTTTLPSPSSGTKPNSTERLTQNKQPHAAANSTKASRRRAAKVTSVPHKDANGWAAAHKGANGWAAANKGANGWVVAHKDAHSTGWAAHKDAHSTGWAAHKDANSTGWAVHEDADISTGWAVHEDANSTSNGWWT